MESVAGSVMVKSGQDFQCYISHVKLPSLSWRLPNIVAGGRAAGAAPQGLCARHSTASTTPCLPGQELGRQHPASLAGVPWDGRGPVGSCYSWWLLQLVARKAGLLLGKEGFIAVDALCSS